MNLEERARELVMSVLLDSNLGHDDLLAALVQAQKEMRERIVREVRLKCPACDNGNCVDGYGQPYECDVCGSALVTIRALEIPGDKEVE